MKLLYSLIAAVIIACSLSQPVAAQWELDSLSVDYSMSIDPTQVGNISYNGNWDATGCDAYLTGDGSSGNATGAITTSGTIGKSYVWMGGGAPVAPNQDHTLRVGGSMGCTSFAVGSSVSTSAGSQIQLVGYTTVVSDSDAAAAFGVTSDDDDFVESDIVVSGASYSSGTISFTLDVNSTADANIIGNAQFSTLTYTQELYYPNSP